MWYNYAIAFTSEDRLMVDPEHEAVKPESTTQYMSTAYSSKITCGVCGAPLHNIQPMYENMDIDWRCGKCLRRDKPVLEDHIT